MRSGVPPPKHQQSSLFRCLLPYLALYLVVFVIVIFSLRVSSNFSSLSKNKQFYRLQALDL